MCDWYDIKSKESFQQLFLNQEIPYNQRNYVWTKDIYIFIDDALRSFEEESYYWIIHMGWTAKNYNKFFDIMRFKKFIFGR